MEYDHKSVLLAEVSQQLISNIHGIFVDCTLGGAGHARAILEKIEADGFVLGIDQDTTVINAAKKKLENFGQQFLFIQGNFKDLDSLLSGKVTGVDGFLFDLGVSSMQLDIAERGFSYKQEGPLDMRMNISQKLSAYEVVNNYSLEDLYRLIRNYGEEKWAKRIANFIVTARDRKPLKTTSDLVKVIKEAIPAAARRKGPHPAKRTFQALRIEVNNELKALESALWQSVKWLNSGGRIVIISYHSLEDRIVKRFFKEGSSRGIFEIITKKPVCPLPEEISENPRSRSAKLRAAERK
jgi:16S rRNA (cytosine1402-N4)-methyltransferase